MNKIAVLLTFLISTVGCATVTKGVFIFEKPNYNLMKYKTACVDVENPKLIKILSAAIDRESLRVVKSDCDIVFTVKVALDELPVEGPLMIGAGPVIEQQDVYLFVIEKAEYSLINSEHKKLSDIKTESIWWGRSAIRMQSDALDAINSLCEATKRLVNNWGKCYGGSCPAF